MLRTTHQAAAGPWRRHAMALSSAVVLAVSALPVLSAVPAATATTAVGTSTSTATGTADPMADLPVPIPASQGDVAPLVHLPKAPISTTACEKDFALACYSPVQYRIAYDLNPLYQQGITGAGRTIVIVDPYGSPTIQSDLDTFDAQWGIPDTQIQIVTWGKVPPFNPKNPTMDDWASETSLDIEYAHVVAPGANLVLLETGVDQNTGRSGFPQIMAAEKSLINQGVGDVFSQSFGTAENTFPGFSGGDYSSLLDLRGAYADAAEHDVSVLAAAGDTGPTDLLADGQGLFPYPVADWPADDPLVTAIGGTQLYLDDAGRRLQPDSVWNDGYGAGGGGLSAVFSRPTYQNAVKSVVGNKRGYPDVSMSAAANGAVWFYGTFDPAHPGWGLAAGTSEGTPVFAGVIALADQYAGHRLGDVNALLYSLGAQDSPSSGLVDITVGDNSFAGVTGYQAGPGYDLASGWGTIDAATFVPALAEDYSVEQ
jgi:subtilase family serine protease